MNGALYPRLLDNTTLDGFGRIREKSKMSQTPPVSFQKIISFSKVLRIRNTSAAGNFSEFSVGAVTFVRVGSR
jgi:hypothetical protein